MINVIVRNAFSEYEKEDSVNFLVAAEVHDDDKGRFKHLLLVAPSKGLNDAWESSKKSEKDSEVFKQEYLREASSWRAQAGLEMISFYSDLKRDVNVVCYLKCVQDVISDLLIRRGLDVFISEEKKEEVEEVGKDA